MNCVEFRRQLAIDPQATAADFVQHRAECPRCAEAHARSLAFENDFARALNIAVPAQLADEPCAGLPHRGGVLRGRP